MCSDLCAGRLSSTTICRAFIRDASPSFVRYEHEERFGVGRPVEAGRGDYCPGAHSGDGVESMNLGGGEQVRKRCWIV
jgi:hypothetical protein